MARPSLVWFRRDLRVSDHHALWQAVEYGTPVVCVYVHDERPRAPHRNGTAGKWWLWQSLRALQQELQKRGGGLLVQQGTPEQVLKILARKTNAARLLFNRQYAPVLQVQETAVTKALEQDGVEVLACRGDLLFEPGEIRNRQGEEYKVFTPFWKACLQRPEPDEPLAAPATLATLADVPAGIEPDALKLQPAAPRAASLAEAWRPGAQAGWGQLRTFAGEALWCYDTGRDRPDREGTSRLSPYLAFGNLSPREVWHGVRDMAVEQGKGLTPDVQAYLRQLGWREFSYHILYHHPHTPTQPLREAFAQFPWQDDPHPLQAWQQGQTGYPLVDAGMRQLAATGWMHNRVRMLVASFLTKHLLLPWQQGAAWFWDALVDADLANNTMGWQWTAGCGADAAPYFRIFNPTTQAQKFDPEGHYIRHWVPELAELPTKWLHQPFAAKRDVLQQAGVTLGRTYPEPLVEHGAARERALAAFDEIKQT